MKKIKAKFILQMKQSELTVVHLTLYKLYFMVYSDDIFFMLVLMLLVFDQHLLSESTPTWSSELKVMNAPQFGYPLIMLTPLYFIAETAEL